TSYSVSASNAIRCYQCDSNEDDSCPARRYFDKRMNAMIDCGSFLSHSPGTFCVKIYQESTGWNSWIKITRRCGARTDYGLAWSCRYWFEAQGVYKEVCYCQDSDGCNRSTAPKGLLHFLIPPVILTYVFV
ncbi:Crooked, partial [Fasciolopsis buskii]